MLKITRNKNVKYIHTENIRYVVENPDGLSYLIFTVSGKDDVAKNEFDPEKAGLVKCGNCYYNVECICDVEVVKTRDAFIVSPNFETGRRFAALDDLKDLVDGFYEVVRNDGSSIYINPDNVDTVEKPYTTVMAKITSGGVVTEVPIEAGDQVSSCTVNVAGGKKFKFDAQEAVQLLSHYKEDAPTLKVKKAKKEEIITPAPV